MHSFDPSIAQKVGVNAAVLYHNILWWAKKNHANGRNVRDGFTWTYNSRKAFCELFPYMTDKQVRLALDRLVACDLVVKGDYNLAMYDRTSWYSPTESASWPVAIGHRGPMDRPYRANGLGLEGQPIPDSKPDDKPDAKRRSRASEASSRDIAIAAHFVRTPSDDCF